MARTPTQSPRCRWCGSDPIYVAYHDTEWGVPVIDDVALYEKLVLDGFQAGLSWLTVLKKRDAFRKAFKNFDPVKVARFTAERRNHSLACVDRGSGEERARMDDGDGSG